MATAPTTVSVLVSYVRTGAEMIGLEALMKPVRVSHPGLNQHGNGTPTFKRRKQSFLTPW
jgi:hypothetical protein